MTSSSTAPNLHQLQHQFAAALQYQSHDLPTTIVSDHFSAQQRLQLYCNNFIIGVTEVLASVYSTVNAMIGDDCFAQLARLHILNHPLRQGDVSVYGNDFAATITAQASLSQSLPYLADLATLEWQRDIVSRLACHDGRLPLEKLRQLEHPTDALCPHHYYFQIPAATRIFSSQYAVVSLWEVVNQADDDHQQQLLADLDINQPQSALIQHYQWQIWQQAITPELIALVTDCQQQRPIAALTPAQLTLLPQLLHHHLVDDICKVTIDD